MRYLILAVLIACGVPTDTHRLDAPNSVDDLRVVHPRVVVVTVTPATSHALPLAKVQYVATVRDGDRRVLRASRWVWSTSDTTVAVVSQGGLATARAPGHVMIYATAYPPWRR